MAAPESVFRPFRSGDADRSDRVAGDRARHREKVREAIRDNIADIIAEESIIGQDKNRIIKVPIRGIKEYRFIYGDSSGGVAQGNGETERGQVVGRGDGDEDGPADRAGDRPGVDYYETDVSLEEVIEMMFEDLELPDLERKRLRHIESERNFRRHGFRQKGIRSRLDKRRTARARLRRIQATVEDSTEPARERFPFHDGDLTYRHVTTDVRLESNAVVICLMDTSGSMDAAKKYLARSFFFLLYQFIRTKYQNVELVFVAHHATAKEVTEQEFFYKGESGGTMISSAYKRALEIIEERYHPTLWNVYSFHCSDGDNFESDNPQTLELAAKLSDACNLFGYGEIKPLGPRYYESSMLNVFRQLDLDNFQTVLIERKEDVWPSFKALLAKERLPVEGDDG